MPPSSVNPPGGKIYAKFTSRDSGVPFTLAGSPVVSVYKDDSTTQSTTGVTLTVDFDGVTGLNHVTIDTAADATFYATGHHYDLVITTGTVNGTSVVGEDVGSFDLVALTPLDVIYTSTLPNQGGLATTEVKLDSGASSSNNAYQYCAFSVVQGTGQGSRACLSYVGSTRVATLDAAWTVAPVATDIVLITPTVNGRVIDKTGFSLLATGLDLITASDPGGVASTFPQMVVQTWRRFFKKSVKAVSGLTIKTYADDNTTVRTTQTYTDDGAGNQTENTAT